MNRYQQKATINQHRLLLDNFRQDEEVYYLSTTGGLDLKRPNIISRRPNINNNKFQVYQVHPTLDPTPSIFSTTNGAVSYIETYDPDEITVVPDTVPIELLSPDSFIVSDAPYPAVTELSLALEPTVVAQPLPTEIPLTYDSTTVSQAIPTPIVTPIVSSSGLPAEYITTNTPPATFQLYCPQEDLVQISHENELGIPMEVLNDTGLSTVDPVYLNSDVPVSSAAMEEEGQLELADQLEEVEVQDNQDTSALLHSNQSQMRIETQADGTLVLYVEGPAQDAVDILSDTEIIQTDTYPVVPNMPVMLPSQQQPGHTESFILLPIDNRGHTVLVPTSSIVKPRPTPMTMRSAVVPRPPHHLLHQTASNLPRATFVVNEEKPKPYRYDLPEEDDDSDPLLENFAMSGQYNLPSPVLSQPNSDQAGETQEIEIPTLEHQVQPISDEEPQVINPNENQTTCETDRDEVLEKTSLGIFRCRFCSRETRLKVLMLNHIKRSHKNQEGSSQPPAVPVSDLPQVKDTVKNDDEILYIHEDTEQQKDQGLDNVTLTIESTNASSTSTSSQLNTTSDLHCSVDAEDSAIQDQAEDVSRSLELNQTDSVSAGQIAPGPVQVQEDVVNDSSETKHTSASTKLKRKRQRLVEWNPKHQKLSSDDPSQLKSQTHHHQLLAITKTSPTPRKYPSKIQNASSTVVERPNPATTTPAPARMRTRSHSGGDRCLRNPSFKGY